MKREDFKLRKVKLSGGSVTVEYQAKVVSGPSIQEVDMTERRLRTPHPDLTNAMGMLNTYVCRTVHLDALDNVRGFMDSSPDKKDLKVFIQQMQDRQSEILDSIDVRSIAINGENDKISVVISSVLSCKGMATALNTPRILLSRSIYGFEVALSESVDEIEEEVFQYLFAGKESQTQMNFGEDQEDEPTED